MAKDAFGGDYEATVLQSGPYPNVQRATGSLLLNDGDHITDSGGDTRLSFTDEGALLLKDEDGNTGITLNIDQSTTFANSIDITNHITASGNLEIAGNISGSGTSTLSVGGNITGSGNLEIAGNVSGSGTSTGSFAYVSVTNLPTSDPAVAGALFTTGSSSSDLGGITGSGCQLVMVSQG